MNSFVRFLAALLALLGYLFLNSPAFAGQTATEDAVDRVAEQYVRFGLQMQNHDKLEYIYIGPQEWLNTARADVQAIPVIQAGLRSLTDHLQESPAALSAVDEDRRAALLDRIVAMITRLDILQGNTPASFDEETQLVFGVTVPRYNEDHFRALAAQLDELIPGQGALSARVERFRDQFVIPANRVEKVIAAAMTECRKRTKQHIELPSDEAVQLNITEGKHWVGFAQYLGRSQTTVHINNQVPIHVERVLQLGCHEAYPGHHTHASLVEEELLNKRGWIEYSFIPLHGPLAVIAEGAANYGVDLAFPRQERIRFERDVVLPMAGLKSSQLALYYRYFDLLDQLNYARNEVARKYLYEGMSKADAIEWLMTFGLEARGTATQRLDFIDAMRTYVINYNFGKEIIRRYVERRAGADRDRQWQVFQDVLSLPMRPQHMLQSRSP